MKNEMHRVATILSATTKDGNGNIAVFAFGIVEAERVDTWDWFLRQVKTLGNFPDWCIVSDRHEGLFIFGYSWHC